MPKTLNEMMIKALPFVIPSILIIFISMFLKTNICETGSNRSCCRYFGVYLRCLGITGTRAPSCNCISVQICCGYRFCSKTVCGSRIGFLSAPARQIYFDVLTAISARNYTNHVILHISAYSYWNERFPVWIIYNGINKPVCG